MLSNPFESSIVEMTERNEAIALNDLAIVYFPATTPHRLFTNTEGWNHLSTKGPPWHFPCSP